MHLPTKCMGDWFDKIISSFIHADVTQALSQENLPDQYATDHHHDPSCSLNERIEANLTG